MLKYESLKDFINQNYKEIISQGVLDYAKKHSDNTIAPILTELTLLSLAWKHFDQGLLTMTLGVSTVFTDAMSNQTSTPYYKIIIHGNVLKNLSDLCLDDIEEVDDTLLQKETATSLFGLPEITSFQLEERAEELHAALCKDIKNDDKDRFRFPVIKIKEKLGMKLWSADLPDRCFGRLYLKPSTATIYDPMHIDDPYDNVAIPRGTILLNRKYYTNDLAPDDIITAAHELVHWTLHQVYFLIMQILDEGYEAMNCTSDPMYLDDAMSMKEKAYFYAEWQANELAIRLAMPKHLIEDAVAEYESTHLSPHDGYYYESMILQLSLDFNIPLLIVKKRLRQLRYEFADGTFVTVDGTRYQPFTFAPGSLSEDETYAIDECHYQSLLNEDPILAALIASSHYIYTGYVVCLFDAKYVIPVITENVICWELSDYARTHVSECCIQFKLRHTKPNITGTTNHDNDFFCRLYTAKDYSEADESNIYHLSQKAKEDLAAFMDEHYHILADMNKNNIVTLHDALHYHKTRKGVTYDEISDRSGIPRETIDAYFAKPGTSKHRNIPLEKMMILCNALQLERAVALDLLKRAQLTLNEYETKGQYYHYLLSITNAPLEVWNQFLVEAGLDPLK